MVHDLFGILKILVAVLGSSAAVAILVGFMEGRAAAHKALWFVLPLCLLLGLLQAVRAEYLPEALGGFALAAGSTLSASLLIRKLRSKRP